MKKTIPFLYPTLFLLFLFCFKQMMAKQSEADSLIALLNKSNESDTLRANLLISIVNSLYLNNPEKSINYAGELEKLAISATGKQNFGGDKYLSEAWMLKGKSYLSLRQNDKADLIFMAAVKLWQKQGDRN